LTASTSYQFNVRAQYQSDDSTYTSYSATSTAVSTAAVASTVSMTLNVGASSTYQLSVGGSSHTVTLSSIVGGVATLSIQSDPITVSLSQGQSSNVDTDGNGTSDTTVTMTTVGGSSATFSLASYTPPSNPPGGGGGGSMPTPVAPVFYSFLINNGAIKTNNQDITLNLSAKDATLMAVSNDSNFTGVSYENYVTSKSWKLSPGFGTKTVYVKLRSNTGGEISTSDSIVWEELLFSDVIKDKAAITDKTTTPTITETKKLVYQFKKDLSVGAINSDVRELQKFLKDRGYFKYPTITNIFGSVTKQALIKYQTANKLKPTGKLDAATRKKINSTTVVVAKPTTPTIPKATAPKFVFSKFLSSGDHGLEIRYLQERLQELGFMPKTIKANGVFGSTTKAAVIKLQKKYNLKPALGYVGPGTREILNAR
jgi:peptidoglycan hydrolase-like protein with peptidoglycan-binding domain